MDTTSGLLTSLTSLGHRLGTVGLTVLVAVVVILAAAAGVTFLLVSELVAAGADPIQVSPVRWTHRT